jgi:hypothetical protein
VPALPKRRRRWWPIAALVLVLGVAAWLAGIDSWPDELRGMRRANDSEVFFRYVAQELAEPSLCGKIPWSVESPGGFFLAPSYERSNCIAAIAGRTRNPRLCWAVRRLGALSFLSRQTSIWSCVQDARSGTNSGAVVSETTMVRLFGEMGYNPDTIQQEGVTPPLVNPKDDYRQIEQRIDLVKRIESAIGAARSPVPPGVVAPNFAYLADMAAVSTDDPNWCLRIPEDLPLPVQRAGFRDWCLFTLASNTRNPRLCRRIPIRPTESDPRLSLQASCLRQANSPYPGGRYGPEVPSDDDRIRALIRMLDLPVPRARDLPIQEISGGYIRFLHELGSGTDPRHAEARERFLERVRQLPDTGGSGL